MAPGLNVNVALAADGAFPHGAMTSVDDPSDPRSPSQPSSDTYSILVLAQTRHVTVPQ